MKQSVSEKYIHFILFALALAAGVGLRLYMLPSQLLLDDEWHGVDEVIGKTVWDLLTHFNPQDNSSLPFNLYNLFLYHTFGWSEFLLRLPALVAGLLALLILPFLLKRTLGGRTWLIFSFLLAISPFLIFYSRFSRAYSPMALLCFAALLVACQWLKTGRQQYAAWFALLTLSAVFVHLFSVILVFVPILVILSCRIAGRFSKSSPLIPQSAVTLKSVAVLTVILFAVCLLLSWPMLLKSAELPWAKGSFSFQSITTAWTLVSGTANPALNLLFLLLCIAGQLFLFKENPLLAWIFLATSCGYLPALLVSRPTGIDAGMVLLRYMIVLVPVALTTVAIALNRLLSCMEGRSGIFGYVPIMAIGTFVLLLFVTGPLPEIYASPNDFTSHSAFQGSYREKTWKKSEAHHFYPDISVREDEIPVFYRWLRGQSDINAIIEYPFDICNFNNLFYYYQHFHRKRTIAGYSADPALLGHELVLPSDQPELPFTLGMRNADDILSRVADQRKLLFRNLVDVSNAAAVQGSGADIVVLHKYLMVLRILPAGTDFVPVSYNSVPLLADQFQQVFGPPLFEDGQIICFRINKAV